MKAIWLMGIVLVAVALATLLRALQRERLENQSLQRQVQELAARADELSAENQRLRTLNAVKETDTVVVTTQSPSTEVLRLRGEVGRLQSLERETAQARLEQMQTARAKLTNAEVQLERMTKLHSENLVSASEFSQAKYTVELLKAEAKGDTAEAARVRLRQAEEELARATELHKNSLISQSEFDQAVKKVDSLKGGKGP